ncbi:MAG TPA: PQQ-binding-like beta-propeller repeat protein [Gemmataceae bacterium]|nr:PQQ-binding-like beta-propeller repeat protein [Gemmataceae bacterium]
MIRILLGSVLTLALTLSLSAADWPRFRGPNGVGTADGPLPPINPKNPIWKVTIPGKGAGSPIVVGGKLFLQTGSADGMKRTLLCLEASTGNTIWTKDVPGQPVPNKVGGLHAKNTLASSTPACDGEMVYCVWWDGSALSLYGYDMAGNEKWQQSLGSFKSEHGAGQSPAVYKDKVYVNIDQDGAAAVTAFDKKTGNKVWSVERPAHRACYTTPFLLEQPGKPIDLIVASTTGIDGYDPDTGKVNWHYTINWPDPKKLRMIGGPVFAGGLLVCSMGEGGNSRYIVALKPGGSGDITATAKAWEANKQCPYVPSMLSRGEHLFWLHDDGRAGCTELKTGKVVWEETLFGNGVTASPVLVGDTILAISEKGQIALLKADKEYELPKRIELGEGVYATPAVVDGKVYIRGTSHLFCFGPKK